MPEYEGLWDWSKTTHLLHNLLSFGVAIQKAKFDDARALSCDFVVYSSYRYGLAGSVTLLVKRFLIVRMDLERAWLVVADIALKCSLFPIAAVYVPNDQTRRCSYFRQFGPFLVDPECRGLMENWNATQGPKLDRDRGGGRDRSLV